MRDAPAPKDVLPFQRVASKKKSALVAEQIFRMIREGVYGVGDRLPPERTIAEQMGVSRPLVREALCALELTGFVESRSGNGTYVTRPPRQPEELEALTILEDSDSLPNVLEARRVIECGMAGLAGRRGSGAALRRAKAALEKMARHAAVQNYDLFNQANTDFHMAIAAMAGNPYVERALYPLLEVMQKRLAVTLRRRAYAENRSYFERTFRAHQDIFRALEAGDEAAATTAMARHFDLLEASVKEEE